MEKIMSEADITARRVDPDRLRNITENFMASKGSLGFTVFGAALATQQMIDVYWPRSSWMYLVAASLVVAAILFWFIYVPRHDASRFGWVQPKQTSARSTKAVALVVLLLFSTWLAANLLQHFVQVPASSYFSSLTLIQSALFLCLIVYVASRSLVYVASRRRIRSAGVRLTIWAVVVAAQGVIAALPIWVSLGPSQRLVWKLLNAGSMGILIMVMGISNYVAMIRMLPKRVAEDEHE